MKKKYSLRCSSHVFKIFTRMLKIYILNRKFRKIYIFKSLHQRISGLMLTKKYYNLVTVYQIILTWVFFLILNKH